MHKRRKGNFLILSISFLFLLVLIFKLTGGVSRDTDPDSKSAARYLIEGVQKTSAFIDERADRLIEEYKRRKAEKEAKKLLLENPVIREVEQAMPIPSDTSDDAIPFEEELYEDTDYAYSETITVPEGLFVPSLVDEVEFREDHTIVYAAAYAKYYPDPNFANDAIGTAGRWEAFLRVGISEDCCYQLVTSDGRLVYADGVHFRRYRENMETTEDITLESEPVLLDVDYISQFPSLPNGCEITSLATVLKYYGFDVTKDVLSKDYLPKKGEGKANFYEEFVGDPASRNSFGCYANAIITAAGNYLSDQHSELTVNNLTGSSFQELLIKIRDNIPVIVWTAAFLETEPGYSNEWIVDGEYLVWKTNLHCEVLIGYDLEKGIVIVSDPMRGIQEYDMNLFIKRFKQFYSQAVTIE